MPTNYCNKKQPKPDIELVDWTLWQRPRVTTKQETDDVGYNIINSYSMLSSHPINGVATGYSQLRLRGIHAMHFSEWPWVPGKIRGIEVKLHVSRLARIMDLTVQLTLNGELVGENLANPYAKDIHVYGGKFSDWKLNKEPEEVDVTKLGLLLDFQPHHSIPSSELVYLRNVQMRISYFPYVIGDIINPNCTLNSFGIKKTTMFGNVSNSNNTTTGVISKTSNTIGNISNSNNTTTGVISKTSKAHGTLVNNKNTVSAATNVKSNAISDITADHSVLQADLTRS